MYFSPCSRHSVTATRCYADSNGVSGQQTPSLFEAHADFRALLRPMIDRMMGKDIVPTGKAANDGWAAHGC